MHVNKLLIKKCYDSRIKPVHLTPTPIEDAQLSLTHYLLYTQFLLSNCLEKSNSQVDRLILKNCSTVFVKFSYDTLSGKQLGFSNSKGNPVRPNQQKFMANVFMWKQMASSNIFTLYCKSCLLFAMATLQNEH